MPHIYCEVINRKGMHARAAAKVVSLVDQFDGQVTFQLEDRIATTVSFMQDYINQTMHLSLVGMIIGKGGQDGGLNRMSLEYDVMDAFSVTGGVMLYQPGENAYFQNLNENDRIFFEARYSF